VLRPVPWRRAWREAVSGGRAATRPRGGGPSAGSVFLRGLYSRRAAPCIGGGQCPVFMFLDGDIRRRCWPPPASGESAPWVVMVVVELLRSAGGGGGSLLGVGPERLLCLD
jgi:hypothetical protein